MQKDIKVMLKQVDKNHYRFENYLSKRRWMSMWHQLDEVIKLQPNKVLEIGPGPGVFKAVGSALGLTIETLDIDPELKPDHVESVFEMPFENGEFDVVCAFQMLEHLPFDKSCLAFKEMVRVANKAIVISLPDAEVRWPMSIYIPKIGTWSFSIPRPHLGRKLHKFDGEHFWELNKRTYEVNAVIQGLTANSNAILHRHFKVAENPYHHFFVFSKNVDSD